MTEEELNVYDSASGLSTLAQLDTALRVQRTPVDSPLGRWFNKISSVRVDRLSDDDLVRAVGQRIHLPVTLVEAARRLMKDVWLGADYPGQMLELVVNAPSEIWTHYPPLLDTALLLASRAGETSAQALAQLGVMPVVLDQVMAAVRSFRRAMSGQPISISGPKGEGQVRLSEGHVFVCGSDTAADVYVEPAVLRVPREALTLRFDGTLVHFTCVDPRVSLNGKAAPRSGTFAPEDRLSLGPFSFGLNRVT